MEQAPLFNNITALGSTAQNPVAAKKTKRMDAIQRKVDELNANRDMNTIHDFEYFELRDSDLENFSAFDAIVKKILDNRETFNDFSGNPDTDFTNLSMAEIQYYNDFLGLDKVGKAIGNAGKAVGHAVGSAATTVAHGARSVGLGVAHEVRNLGTGAIHQVEKDAVKVAQIGRDAGVDIAHGTRAVGLATAHGARTVGVAVAPYWKVLATAALVTGLALTGVGLPLAISIGAATLTGLDAIKPADPTLPAGFGTGGDGGGGGESAGFPSGGSDGSDDSEDEDNQSPADQQRQAQDDAAAQAQAEAEAADHKKKLLLWGGGIVAAIVVIYFITRKK